MSAQLPMSMQPHVNSLPRMSTQLPASAQPHVSTQAHMTAQLLMRTKRIPVSSKAYIASQLHVSTLLRMSLQQLQMSAQTHMSTQPHSRISSLPHAVLHSSYDFMQHMRTSAAASADTGVHDAECILRD